MIFKKNHNFISGPYSSKIFNYKLLDGEGKCYDTLDY